MTIHTFISKPSADYELLDSGEGMKLERYGKIVISRPDPQALWKKALPESMWSSADASFVKQNEKGARLRTGVSPDEDGGDSENERGKWITTPGMPEKWNIKYGEATMEIKLTPFKHTGLFPEQLNNWQWTVDVIRAAIKNSRGGEGEDKEGNKVPSVLNLFGYTGGATLACAAAGAAVTHVDASRAAVTWANENAALSGLKDKPIKWMLDDAVAFVKREVRRGRRYDGIIMDPPAFGRGTKGEIWKIDEQFLALLDDCLKLLSDKPLFMIVNGYAAGYSAIAYENNLQTLVDRFGGILESGELTLEESSHNGSAGRLLPCGIVSRWKAA